MLTYHHKDITYINIKNIKKTKQKGIESHVRLINLIKIRKEFNLMESQSMIRFSKIRPGVSHYWSLFNSSYLEN